MLTLGGGASLHLRHRRHRRPTYLLLDGAYLSSFEPSHFIDNRSRLLFVVEDLQRLLCIEVRQLFKDRPGGLRLLCHLFAQAPGAALEAGELFGQRPRPGFSPRLPQCCRHVVGHVTQAVPLKLADLALFKGTADTTKGPLELVQRSSLLDGPL